jgi:hypothetical protein
MGLLLKAFKPENALEAALVAALQDVAAAPRFYRLFLTSELYVLGQAQNASSQAMQRLTTDAQTRVVLMEAQVNGRRILPIFSAVRRIREYLGRTEGYLVLSGAALLDVIGADVELALNPSSGAAKAFSIAEVNALRSGAIFGRNEAHVLRAGAALRVVTDDELPAPYVAGLRQLLAAQTDVVRAYLLADAAQGALVLAVDAPPLRCQAIFDEAMALAHLTLPADTLVAYTPTSALNQALYGAPTFYKR